MHPLINLVIRENLTSRNGEHYIQHELLKTILRDQEIEGEFQLCQIDGRNFVAISDLEESLRHHLGIRHSLFPTKEIDEKNEATPEPPEQKRQINLAEFDITKAIAKAASYRHEFVDYFIDERTIERKCLTLSILQEIVSYATRQKYMQDALTFIKQRQLTTDFDLSSLKAFAKSIKWYKKVGLTTGCLRVD